MEMKVNIEAVLAIYKQKVAELEHELILQQALNATLQAAIQELQKVKDEESK